MGIFTNKKNEKLINLPMYLVPNKIQELYTLLSDISKYNSLGDLEAKDAVTDVLINRLNKQKGLIYKERPKTTISSI